MIRGPHENVASALVDPRALPDLELRLMLLDLRAWPVASAPICVDGPRRAFQIRARMLTAQRGAWDIAQNWTPIWISFGASWRDADEPLPWAAHQALWSTLETVRDHVRFHKRLGGVPRLSPVTPG